MYRLFDKDRYESEAGEKPHRLRGQPTGVAQNFADEVAKTCLLSVKIAQMVSKTATRKLNIAV